jgi:pimeloyl-ACP methyl ester carboxylesterase
MATATEEIRLALARPGRPDSHLSMRLDLPPSPPLWLLYLHGFGSHQAGEKAEFFRARANQRGLAFASIDFEGHGSSGGTMRELTLTRNLEDIARADAYLVERGAPRLVLVGSSMGAGSALWYAALHPERVAAGLHLAPALDLEHSLLAWAGPERARQWEETGLLHFKSAVVDCELRWDLVVDLRRYPLPALTTSLASPTLILQGLHDLEVPWRGTVELIGGVSGAVDLHLFADGDHRLTDRKERLWELMVEFLIGRQLLPAGS